MGGLGVGYWEPIKERFGIDVTVVNKIVDPTFSFMTVDHDGQIRMDCSSPYAAARLIAMKNDYQVAFGNDPDSDRHGIVTPSAGLLNPNHYLAVAVRYLYTHRPNWSGSAGVGKTLVSSGIIDRVAASLGHQGDRSSRRLQMVCRWPLQRHARFRRRRKRGRQLPSPRWLGLEHR